MSADTIFTKDDLDMCLRKLAKEFRKLNGTKTPAEIILIGGASVLINYNFRDSTYDIDALIQASSAMKEAINKVGDELGLPNGWLNSDFTKTGSYSPKLVQYSVHYRKFSNILEVRTISSEYLVAMKLMSGRQYKNDISDIVGVIYEEQKRGNYITLDNIKTAVCNLYGSWDALPQTSISLITEIMTNNDLNSLYEKYRNSEMEAKNVLIDFEAKYPNVTNIDNANDIINSLKKRQKN